MLWGKFEYMCICVCVGRVGGRLYWRAGNGALHHKCVHKTVGVIGNYIGDFCLSMPCKEILKVNAL